jgi:exosortase
MTIRIPTSVLDSVGKVRDSVRTSPRQWIAGAALACAILVVYFPILLVLMDRWANSAEYSHGWLVPLFSLYLLYARRQLLAAKECWCPSWWGAGLLAFGLALHAAGTVLYLEWVIAVSLLPCLAGLAALLGGWPALRWSWPAVAFLGFMVPLPYQVEIGVAQPLQKVCTYCSTYALATLGLPAFNEGNIIKMGERSINIVHACSGLSMLVIFFALCTAVAVLMGSERWRLWQRLFVVASSVPIALVSNITRIVATAMFITLGYDKLAELIFHDYVAGYLMAVLACILLWLELRLMAWLIRSEEVRRDKGALARSAFVPSSPWGATKAAVRKR